MAIDFRIARQYFRLANENLESLRLTLASGAASALQAPEITALAAIESAQDSIRMAREALEKLEGSVSSGR